MGGPFGAFLQRLFTEAHSFLIPVAVLVFTVAIILKMVGGLSRHAGGNDVALVPMLLWFSLGLMATGLISYVANLAGGG
jgi:hypothetical protein